MVLKIHEIMPISLPHTQDIMFQKNLGKIFASRIQEVALKLPYEAYVSPFLHVTKMAPTKLAIEIFWGGVSKYSYLISCY